MRTNRKMWPKALVEVSDKAEPGTCRYVMSQLWPYMLALEWFDNKVVKMLSTIHRQEVVEVERVSQRGRRGVGKPLVVKHYTWYMGGVDLQDQLRSYYEIKLQVRKWPTHVFMWLLDAGATNSHIVWTVKSGIKISGREFRLMLCRQLVNLHLDRKRCTKLLPASPRHERYIRRVAAPAGETGPAAASRTLLPAAAVSALSGTATRWRDHTATKLSVRQKLRCVYCCERAEAAVRDGLVAPVVSKTNFVCSTCTRPIKFGCSAELPLCIKPRPGLRSCFVMYHENKHILERRAATPTALLAMEDS